MVRWSPERATFSQDQLDNATRFDDRRRLRGAAASELVAEVWAALQDGEQRQRARKEADERALLLTLEILLANLLAAHLNRIDDERFVATPFSNNAFAWSTVSTASLRSLRDLMGGAGLIEGQHGYQRLDNFADDIAFSKLTRLRASPALAALFDTADLGRSSLRIEAKPEDVIVLKDAKHKQVKLAEGPPEPAVIEDSRSVLMAMNESLSVLKIDLPDDAWARVATRERKAESMKEDAYRLVAGDETQRVLYRVFNENWARGGRIYGGWWMQVPKVERSHLTINDEPTSELDYGSLHPAILYAVEEKALDFDPYAVPGYDGPEARELSKRTFMRLINPSRKHGSKGRLRVTAEDRLQLPDGADFQTYVKAFKQHLGPISAHLDKGVGMALQRQDSDLAISILKRLLDQGITALPIHDSFIVTKGNIGRLRDAMTEEYQGRFGQIPIIKPS
jgi:hypothetical protein